MSSLCQVCVKYLSSVCQVCIKFVKCVSVCQVCVKWVKCDKCVMSASSYSSV